MKDRAGARTFVGWFFVSIGSANIIFKIRNNHIPQDTRVHVHVSLICIFDRYGPFVGMQGYCMYVHAHGQIRGQIHGDTRTHRHIHTDIY